MGRRSQPWYRKHDGWWYATIRGDREKLARGEAQEKAAWKRFHELMAAPPPAPVDASITLVALSEAHAEAVQGELAEETFANYRKYIGMFMDAVGRATAAEELRPHHLETWLKSRTKWGPSTKRLASTIVCTLFVWGKTQGHLKANPLVGIKRPRAKSREMAMDRKTFDVIIEGISKRGRRLKDFLVFMRETGCRPSEAYRLESQHIDFEAAVAVFDGKTTKKTGKKRRVYLTPAAIEICRRHATEYPEGPIFRNAVGRPWTRDLLGSRFGDLRTKLKLPKGTCSETIRHGWITDALVVGVPIATVAELAGHTDTAMISKVYSKLHERTDHLQDELKKVRPPQ